MKSKFIYLLAFVLIILESCSYNDERIIDTDIAVVESYLLPYQAINVKLSKLYLYTEDGETEDEEFISDALVTIITDTGSYLLSYDESIQKYIGEDNNLIAVPDTDYSLEINYNDVILTSSTTVPLKPDSVKLSEEVLVIESGHLGPGQNEGAITVSWLRPDNQSQYQVIIEYLDEEYDPIFDFMESDAYDNFRILSTPPITGDTYNINQRQLIFYGNYQIIIQSINEEYADLYEDIGQSTQNLTQPLTNIENGFGIFTGVNSDTVQLRVSN